MRRAHAIPDTLHRSPHYDKDSSWKMITFVAQSHGFGTRRLRFPFRLSLHGQGWLPAVWQTLPGGIRFTRWIPIANFSCQFLLFLLPTSLRAVLTLARRNLTLNPNLLAFCSVS